MKACIVKLQRKEESSNVDHIIEGLNPYFSDFYLIASNYSGPYPSQEDHGKNHPKIQQMNDILSYMLKQVIIVYELYKNRTQFDIVIFHTGGMALSPSFMLLRILRIPTILIVTGSSSRSNASGFSLIVLRFLELLSLLLSNKIITYSKHCISEFDLGPFSYKTSVMPTHHLDINKFNIRSNIEERDNVIGFVGRLGKEKGILNLVQSVEYLDCDKVDKVIIVGGGNLEQNIQEYIKESEFSIDIELKGWVPREEIPDYLNTFKLLILPSKIEGLPMTLLQAMACGTPPLATPVGAIPDVITHGNTGYILPNNDPESIADNCNKLITNTSELELVSIRSRKYIEQNFTKEMAKERWKRVLIDIYNN